MASCVVACPGGRSSLESTVRIFPLVPAACLLRSLARPVAALTRSLPTQATRAYKRNVQFDGFSLSQSPYPPPPSRDAAWLLNSTGMGDDYYDEYDEYDETPVPNEWESMEPKFVNGRRVLLNLQIE